MLYTVRCPFLLQMMQMMFTSLSLVEKGSSVWDGHPFKGACQTDDWQLSPSDTSMYPYFSWTGHSLGFNLEKHGGWKFCKFLQIYPAKSNFYTNCSHGFCSKNVIKIFLRSRRLYQYIASVLLLYYSMLFLSTVGKVIYLKKFVPNDINYYHH